MDELVSAAQLIEKLAIPIVVGIVGWFVKDYLFGVYARREEMVRKEWERRLLEVWSPLYYWSGVVLFKTDKTGWERHGLKEMEAIVARNAHLIPRNYYNVLIKIVQVLAGQETTLPSEQDIRVTRVYIYNQVKTFNYLLYRRSGWFEVTTYTDFFATMKYLLRFTSQALKHVLTWLVIVGVAGITYYAVDTGTYWLVAIVVAAIVIPVLYDWEKQIQLHRALNRETSPKPKQGPALAEKAVQGNPKA